MSPVPSGERYAHIDLLRGIALFGVLLMNVFSGFSTSLFGYITSQQPFVLAEFVEFRALSLFAFLFGVGAAIQAERVPNPHAFLARRFAVLFAVGLAHIVFIWNGDILAQYGVSGMLLIPFVRMRTVFVLAGAAFVFVVPRFASLPIPLPSEAQMRVHAAQAMQVYSQASWPDVLLFRCSEALHWVMPLWVQSLPFTLGLMLPGMAAWQHDALRHPRQHRRTLLSCYCSALQRLHSITFSTWARRGPWRSPTARRFCCGFLLTGCRPLPPSAVWRSPTIWFSPWC
ncbi:MAG: heparan-alpha-glucosaminide N-acetyltransferase domain-containing protein [Bryobacteraceae bacterium]|nr:heparan-alpha-glucosaminide N-acetyltransferase domain-containing protein [Bryobacteraceae bacterium]